MCRYQLHTYKAKYVFSNEKLGVDTILGEQTSTTNSNERLWLEFLFSALLIPFTDMDPVAIAMLADSKRISK